MELAGNKLHQEKGNCQSYSCAAHHLQLCIEEGLHITVISEALTAAKKLVTFGIMLLPLLHSEEHKKQFLLNPRNCSRLALHGRTVATVYDPESTTQQVSYCCSTCCGT